MDLNNPSVDYSPETAPREVVEEMVKMWRECKAKRLEVEKEAGKLKEHETSLKSFIMECFKVQKWEGMMVGGRSTGLSANMVPVVADKEALIQYILDTRQLDLLQFRLSNAAVKERWDSDVEVPGVSEIEIYDLFDRKV